MTSYKFAEIMYKKLGEEYWAVSRKELKPDLANNVIDFIENDYREFS